MEQYTQLTMDFENGGIGEESQPVDPCSVDNSANKCKHSIVFKALKEDYVTYCKRCGKILSVHHKDLKEVK